MLPSRLYFLFIDACRNEKEYLVGNMFMSTKPIDHRRRFADEWPPVGKNVVRTISHQPSKDSWSITIRTIASRVTPRYRHDEVVRQANLL